MLDKQYKAANRDTISAYEQFVRPWRRAVDGAVSEYFIGTVDAYSRAIKLGFHRIDWEYPQHAHDIVESLSRFMPDGNTVSTIPWRILVGQIESTYSREAAAETFSHIREHEYASLVPFFYWDTGALTYYSEEEIRQRSVPLPNLADIRTWQTSATPRADKAIVVGMDLNFFRIYGPMILFNAQQIPDIDFVLLICGSTEEVQLLVEDAHRYLSGLSGLNGQPAPSIVQLQALSIPGGIANEVTFYAALRFIALPELLEIYKTVYTMNADLYLISDPVTFLTKPSAGKVSFPKSARLLGVPPWRRYMAGNVIARAGAESSVLLKRQLDYLSVGLSEPNSWMLDQNSLSYAVEGAQSGEFASLSNVRPTLSSSIMATWETNFKKRPT